MSLPTHLSGIACSGDCDWRYIGPEHLATWAHEIGCKERNLARPAAYIKDTHSWRHACSLEVFTGRWFKKPCLPGKALKFKIGMAEHILRIFHGDHPKRSTGLWPKTATRTY